ncbi:MAG: cytochrome c3 family protein [Candidatus Aminicenantes bacterium]|nr:cytochrome c3 family protein [Candidatus Aminicenantes bacterium]
MAVAFIQLAGFVFGSTDQKAQWTGSRTSPVHRIPLKDDLNQGIVPTEPNPLPFSSRYSCAPCHDYAVIEKGLHFSAGRGGSDGRPGEPWIRLDEKTGTILPVSLRKWPGTWDLKTLGLSTWDFTLLFGRHLAGGGIAEPTDGEATPGSRWDVSGRIEINCMGCHNGSSLQDHSEWARQVLRQNFRWAATAAAGLGEVGGMASRLAGTWDVFDGPNADDSEWAVAPSVRYDRTIFDSKHRAFLDIALRPADERCLSCHAVTPVGAAKSGTDGAVHAAAGLRCVSCHRNGIDHDMTRGYEGESGDEPEEAEAAKDLTCAGCHLGKDAAGGGKGWSGRMGAPYPLHKGLPKVHFERLSCTVCHSGPLPAHEAVRVRTARANRLGIFGIASWATDLPAVLEPVYIRDGAGKLIPHRIVWPAYWAQRKKDGTIVPLSPEAVLAAAGPVFAPPEKAARILSFLSGALGDSERAVLVLDANAFELNVDGGLTPSSTQVAADLKGLLWTAGADGILKPLVPEIDPAASEPQLDAEAKVRKILESLGSDPGIPGPPVLAIKNFIYKLRDGYLDKTEISGPARTEPEFGYLVGDKLQPLLSDYERRTLTAVAGKDSALTEEQVALALADLNKAAVKDSAEAIDAVYISGGKLHELDKSGHLKSRDHKAAGFVAWPLGHNVRPSRQALGVHGCTDCHSLDSKFFFGTVKAEGPLLMKRTIGRPASSFMKLGGLFHRMFGLSFAARPVLKVVLTAAVAVIGLMALLAALLGLGRLSGLLEKRR